MRRLGGGCQRRRRNAILIGRVRRKNLERRRRRRRWRQRGTLWRNSIIIILYRTRSAREKGVGERDGPSASDNPSRTGSDGRGGRDGRRDGYAVKCRAHGLLCDVAARPRTAFGSYRPPAPRYFRVRLPYRRRSTPPPSPAATEKNDAVSVLCVRSRTRNRHRRAAAVAITGRPVRGGFLFPTERPSAAAVLPTVSGRARARASSRTGGRTPISPQPPPRPLSTDHQPCCLKK